jgi:glyoxylate reductase
LKAFITRQLPEEAIHICRAAAEIDVWPGDDPPPRDTMLHKVADLDGLLCLLTDKIDEELLAAAPHLKVVSQMAVGFDNIDVDACKRRGIPVGNTPGVLTETTADLAFALLISAARRVVEAEAYTRSGKWTTWSPMLLTGRDIHHSTIGIIGMGRIGYEMARRCRGFEMTVLYSDANANAAAERDFGAQRVEMDELLERSDFVSVHTPLLPETRHLMGAAQFARMKRTAIFVNSARGPIVDQVALAEALKNGTIAGAGIDVYEVEPLPLDDALLSAPNAVLLPHIASASVATRTKMAVLAAQNLVAGLQGKPLPNPVW